MWREAYALLRVTVGLDGLFIGSRADRMSVQAEDDLALDPDGIRRRETGARVIGGRTAVIAACENAGGGAAGIDDRNRISRFTAYGQPAVFSLRQRLLKGRAAALFSAGSARRQDRCRPFRSAAAEEPAK